MGKRILVTGVSSFLGAALARRLAEREDVEFVGGVDLRAPHDIGAAEYIKADIRTPLIQKVLTSTSADTLVHADLSSAPVSVGGRSAQKELNVIGTMQLLGACQRVEAIKKVVVRSSTAVYGNDSRDPSILSEDWSNASNPGGYSKDLEDAETFGRDFGRRRPDVLLTVLRFANVIGPTAITNMTQLFSLPLIPTALGYDPRLQFIHEVDAVNVLEKSVTEDHPGVFNVAADGVVYLSQAIRLARRLPLPILTPLGTLAGDMLRRLGVIDFPSDQIALLVNGRVVDNTRLKEIFGYSPEYTTKEAFDSYLNGATSGGSSPVRDWERELYEFVSARLASMGTRRGPTRPYIVGKEG